MLRAILFDAVGTLIHPEPSAARIYAEIGARHGSQLSVNHIRERFQRAFARQESIDRAGGWRTSEERELERWRSIVAEVLDDVDDPEVCFQALYGHFATPQAWRCEPGTGAVLRELRQRGCILGLASNYDWRLRPVVAGLPELQPVDNIFISSELGWRKPASEFYAMICTQLHLPSGEVLMVGDDIENDLVGAETAGLQAVLLDPEESDDIPGETVANLREVVRWWERMG